MCSAMNEHIIPLSDTRRCVKAVCGSKSAALAKILHAGIPVPRGFCIGAEIYRNFLAATGLREKILMELGRKQFEDMRWEEMWDASLRIRNLFVKAPMPSTIREILVGALKEYCPDKAVAIRSSSLAEDSAQASFAGVHESFINIVKEEEIVKHIKLVWASLWSDAALAYRKELCLDVTESAMSVIVQEMICGEKSGVAFGMNPQNTQQAVIECVFGLNKGLVDGDIEPDQWVMDRQTGTVLQERIVEHATCVVPAKEGVSFASRNPEDTDTPTLDAEDVKRVFVTVKKLEDIFGMPQDMEWTYCQGNLYVLQSRPITTVKKDSKNDRRSFDVSLRRSFENLKALSVRIENDLLPQLIAQADKLKKKNLDNLSDAALIRELEYRKNVFDQWKNVYWEDFIPFAHGVRLLGEVYNDNIAPDDPYEFLDLLTGSGMKSIERNHFLEQLAAIQHNSEGESLPRDIDSFLSDYGVLLSAYDTTEEKHKVLSSFLKRLSHTARANDSDQKKDAALLKRRFIHSFSETEQPFAYDVLSLAQKSYQLRDDDNMYLGRIEEELNRALLESRKRLGSQCEANTACTSYEEVIRAIKDPVYVPHEAASEKETGSVVQINARQLKGQPAGKGIGRGKARVVKNVSDLFAVQEGEILVCDAIDPNMTFVIPLVAAIVERRGGMLIHGAIIAREYGLPCVTGIPQATEFIKTGDDITVDGYFGLVTNHTKGTLL